MAGAGGLLGLRPRPPGRRAKRDVLRRYAPASNLYGSPPPADAPPCRAAVRPHVMAGAGGLLGLRPRPPGRRAKRDVLRRCAPASNLYGLASSPTHLPAGPPPMLWLGREDYSGFALALPSRQRDVLRRAARLRRTSTVRLLPPTHLRAGPPCGPMSWLGREDYSGFALALRAVAPSATFSGAARLRRTSTVRLLPPTHLRAGPPCGPMLWLGREDYSGFALALRAVAPSATFSGAARLRRTSTVRLLPPTHLRAGPPCGPMLWLGREDSNLRCRSQSPVP